MLSDSKNLTQRPQILKRSLEANKMEPPYERSHLETELHKAPPILNDLLSVSPDASVDPTPSWHRLRHRQHVHVSEYAVYWYLSSMQTTMKKRLFGILQKKVSLLMDKGGLHWKNPKENKTDAKRVWPKFKFFLLPPNYRRLNSLSTKNSCVVYVRNPVSQALKE